MKSVIVAIVGLAFLLGTTAFAQDKPTKIELGIDYSLVDFNPKVPGTTSQVMNGGGGSIVYFPIDWLGIKMELQGYGNTTQTAVIPVGNPVVPRGGTFTAAGNLFTYMFGPEFKKRGRFEPYAHLLVGGAHSNVYGNFFSSTKVAAGTPSAAIAPDNNAFAFTVGFGIDIHINRWFSVRPVEVGYLHTRFGNPFGGSQTQNSFRYIAGAVFNF